jgi:CRP-like cAMP-binding protein
LSKREHQEEPLTAPIMSAKKECAFDPRGFLATIGEGRRIVAVAKKQTIYAQGAACDAVFYIQTGKVRLTVVSKMGKEATLGILSEGEFFGEGGLAGQPVRMGSATAMTDCELMRIDKKTMTTRQQRLVESMCANNRFVSFGVGVDDAPRLGTLEQRPPIPAEWENSETLPDKFFSRSGEVL